MALVSWGVWGSNAPPRLGVNWALKGSKRGSKAPPEKSVIFQSLVKELKISDFQFDHNFRPCVLKKYVSNVYFCREFPISCD